MAKKINKKPKKESIIIPKKAFILIVCLFPLIALILSKRDVGGLGLLIIGIGVGILIGKEFFKK
jgi:hypothetical protein